MIVWFCVRGVIVLPLSTHGANGTSEIERVAPRELATCSPLRRRSVSDYTADDECMRAAGSANSTTSIHASV
ncbi:hypothetical protein PMI06_007492 [Burkholderia sp. BT03]|nr:hypothetical protein PMI06_007492 [Burkholderia sp. BT03]SKC92365.1 hypothetical protein SAMN06266956_5105 [Paraburkholderia hospita]